MVDVEKDNPQENLHVDPGFWTKTSLIQLGYAVWVNLTMVQLGMAMSFSAVMLPQLTDPESTINCTMSEQSWIASGMTLSAPVASVSSGILLDKFGRRLILIIAQIPITVGYIYISAAKTATSIIIGRVITGIGCGLLMGAPRVYVTEISLPNMRGVNGALPSLAMAVGITLEGTLGLFHNWSFISLLAVIYAIMLFVANLFLPESPYYVLRDNTEKARECLTKFRSKKYDIDGEMKQLIDYKRNNDISRIPFRKKILAIFAKSARRPFCIIFFYSVFGQFTGISVVIGYTVDMFKLSSSSIDPYTCNIILGFTRLFAAIATSVIMYKVRRRTLAITSALGCAVSFIILSVFLMCQPVPSVFPLICFMAYIISSTLGYYTLPYMIMYEIYPLQIRGFLGGISVACLMFLMFSYNKLYLFIESLLGFPLAIMLFGVTSFIGAIFLYYFLPETQGLTLQEIEEYFNMRRPSLVSQRRVTFQDSKNVLSTASSKTGSILKKDSKSKDLASMFQSSSKTL